MRYVARLFDPVDKNTEFVDFLYSFNFPMFIYAWENSGFRMCNNKIQEKSIMLYVVSHNSVIHKRDFYFCFASPTAVEGLSSR